MSRYEEETDDLWRNVLTDAAVNNWCLTDENADDPRKMLDAIIRANVAQAIDPAISADAQRLQREGFEMARERAKSAAIYALRNFESGARGTELDVELESAITAAVDAVQMDGLK